MYILNPLEQFEIQELILLKTPILSFTFTNIGLYGLIGTIIILGLINIKSKENLINKKIIINEVIFYSILNMIRNQIGKKEEKYIGFIYSLFSFILISNLLGLIPYGFTITSHFALTLSLSVAIFIGVTIIGLQLHKLAFFSYFIPAGTPLALTPLLVAIEFISYISKAISLGIRLAANMIAGHTLLKIISTFIWKFLITSKIAFIISIIPIILLIALIGLELGIAILQAFVFTNLTCSYIRDSINLH